MERRSDPHIRFIRIGGPGNKEPHSALAWLRGILVGAGMISLAIVFFSLFLVLLGVGVIVVPVYLWWKRRKLPPRDPAEHTDGETPVIIDVEGEVVE